MHSFVAVSEVIASIFAAKNALSTSLIQADNYLKDHPSTDALRLLNQNNCSNVNYSSFRIACFT